LDPTFDWGIDMIRIRAAARRGILRMASATLIALAIACACVSVAMAQDLPLDSSRLAVGWGHSLALRPDGAVLAWGCNYYGQVGDGSTTHRGAPVVVATGYKAVSAGSMFSLGITADGTLMAWGQGLFGQLGDGLKASSYVPKVIDTGYAAVSAGGNHSLGLKTDGTLVAWGSNGNGAIGDGTWTERLTPTVIGTGYAAVSAGGAHSLALKTDGTLLAWGNNSEGQLGDGTLMASLSPKVIGVGYKAIAAGSTSSFAIKEDGTLQAWGRNAEGQLGDGTTVSSLVPKDIDTGYVVIEPGSRFTMGIKTDGTLMVWGADAGGALGLGSALSAPVPTPVGSGYACVAASLHTLVIGTDGVLQAWGFNDYGQVGNGQTAGAFTPVTIADWGAPVSTAAEYPGWSTAPVSVAISAVDGRGSGVAQTWYRFGDGPANLYPPCEVTAEGATTVWYWSIDFAGNAEVPRSTTVMLDLSAPVTTADLQDSYVGAAQISVGATDAGSGVAETVIVLDGQRVDGPIVTVSDFGVHVLQYYSIDVAGNVEAARLASFTVVSPKTPTALTISTCDPTVRYSHGLTLSGALQPAVRGDLVTVEALLPGSTTWVTVSTRSIGWVNKTGAGRWSSDYRPRQRGIYAFRASFAGDAAREASQSAVLYVTVR
jgi:alpha-tubulin suppressor-like RCC1 family protein